LIRLDDVAELDREVFGPILHVVTFAAGAMNQTLEAIMASGYGLTLGVHTRIGSAADAVRARARVGNLYVNRSMIGAVVGVQPFGGEGLSGTGPKAGGPHYLPRFCVERTWTVDTTSAGGNASLLSL
jgi:RHH-type proline utilization regulon transcriptional repressor/proline dehydrogenase/delta 1-pyrroline-5-carboxylate dehydrogenase